MDQNIVLWKVWSTLCRWLPRAWWKSNDGKSDNHGYEYIRHSEKLMKTILGLGIWSKGNKFGIFSSLPEWACWWFWDRVVRHCRLVLDINSDRVTALNNQLDSSLATICLSSLEFIVKINNNEKYRTISRENKGDGMNKWKLKWRAKYHNEGLTTGEGRGGNYCPLAIWRQTEVAWSAVAWSDFRLPRVLKIFSNTQINTILKAKGRTFLEMDVEVWKRGSSYKWEGVLKRKYKLGRTFFHEIVGKLFGIRFYLGVCKVIHTPRIIW